MILHPGILSLIIGSGIVVVMMTITSMLGLKIISGWDLSSSSAQQLSLERKTYLISTVVNYALFFEVLSVFLFIYTVDDIHNLFVGAMCATGSLNANPVGWKVLYTKIAIFFLSATWIVLNYIDQKAEDYPLVELKYTLLLFLTPLLILDSYLLIKYFLGLNPDIITSCCGALFGEGEESIASTVASFPVKPMMIIFYTTVGIFMLGACLTLKFNSSILKYLFSVLSFAFFAVSIASIISFVSLYYYEIPTHHCPFDIIQKDYNFVGYPIYTTLFGGVFFGMIAGMLEPFKKIASLNDIIKRSQKKWVVLSMVFILIFIIFCSWPTLFSNFTM
jgi:hypothetical protein